MHEAIRERRSIRKFTDAPLTERLLDEIVEMGAWAPSGLNNQPWKFITIQDKNLLNQLAQNTKYKHIIEGAPACIVAFFDTACSYHREKDLQAIGACIQNMLLAIHEKGLGGVWLGEILNKRAAVEELLQVPPTMELMAVVALGYPDESKGQGSRKPLSEIILAKK